MALKKIVDGVYKDEELRQNKITKKTIFLVVEALKRYIAKELKEQGVFKFLGLFTLKVKAVKGWKAKNLHTNEELEIKDFKRLYLSPSQKLKDTINE